MQVAQHGRGFHTPDTCQITIKIIISEKSNVLFIGKLLVIPFDYDRAKKNIELQLFVLKERKKIFLARQISARQRGAVMAFILDRENKGYVAIKAPIGVVL